MDAKAFLAIFESHKNELNLIEKSLLIEIEKVDREEKLLAGVTEEDMNKMKDIKSYVISINIGGKTVSFCSSIMQITSLGNILPAVMFRKFDHLLPKDKNGRTFLDFDSHWIEPRLNFLRHMAMWDGDNESHPLPNLVGAPHHELQLKFLFKCFAIQSECELKRSVILAGLPSESRNSLKNYLPDPTLPFHLIYRASSSGLTCSSFHFKCKGHKNTVVIIRDKNGNVFGGYADVEFKSEDRQYKSDNAFLFSLQKQGVSVCFKLKQIAPHRGCSVYNTKGNLFMFGAGDLYVSETDAGSSLGKSYELLDKSAYFSNEWLFEVDELELYAVESNFERSLPPPCSRSKGKEKTLVKSAKKIYEYQDQISEIRSSLLGNIMRERGKLLVVAKFMELDVRMPETNVRFDEDNFQHVVDEIHVLNQQLSAGRTVSTDASSIVYINAGGTVLAVSKATLLQAPNGTPIANMASDVWGHSLDSDGNIFQDVSPELFTAIINYLRLKALGTKMGVTGIPPIVIYAEQKNALKNLLQFYLLSDIPVRLLNAVKVSSHVDCIM